MTPTCPDHKNDDVPDVRSKKKNLTSEALQRPPLQIQQSGGSVHQRVGRSFVQAGTFLRQIVQQGRGQRPPPPADFEYPEGPPGRGRRAFEVIGNVPSHDPAVVRPKQFRGRQPAPRCLVVSAVGGIRAQTCDDAAVVRLAP
eukprot:CAMPEP_0194344034 /NCGR_PEP_ID=MMETSP0171-20130528/99599_1 /TAXON_ID=218684 /ORGANISM="Corethron pennatum, Strain L29A3" /LENGTH=141 /DNA_ID=CAMNT_0039110517 /DNA_START=175 /DNA_END=601 /DNA_ORIENTATION=+